MVQVLFPKNMIPTRGNDQMHQMQSAMLSSTIQNTMFLEFAGNWETELSQ